MPNVVGQIDYECCERCLHYQPNRGGCEPMEEERQILYIDWLTETIRCQEFKEKES